MRAFSQCLICAQLPAQFLMVSPAFASKPEFSGRLQLDYATAEAGRLEIDLQEGALRRFRIGVKGRVGDALSYKTEIDIKEDGELVLEDAYVEWQTAGGQFLRLGQFNTPNSLDEQTSSRFLATFERAAFVDAFEFGRQLGLSTGVQTETWTVEAGTFVANLENGGVDGSITFAGRASYSPSFSDSARLHLGASFRHRDQGSEAEAYTYRQHPYTRLTGPVIAAPAEFSSDLFVGFEGAVLWQSSWLASEVGSVRVDPVSGFESHDSYTGIYGEMGHFLGGRRTYQSGAFTRPVIDHPVSRGGPGAVSIALRYDHLNLSQSSDAGGTLDTFIAAIEWWPEDNIHLGINVYHAESEQGATPVQLTPFLGEAPVKGRSDASIGGILARFQFDF